MNIPFRIFINIQIQMEYKQENLNEHKRLIFKGLYTIDHQNYDMKCKQFIIDNHLEAQFDFYYDKKIKKTRRTRNINDEPIKQQSYIMELGHFKKFIQSLSHSYYNCQDIFNDIENRRKNTSNYYKRIANEYKKCKKSNKHLTIKVEKLETQLKELKNEQHSQDVKRVFSYSKTNIPNIS